MRTLASTFDTRGEAEAAAGRLEAIGIPRERIMFKDVAATADAPGGAGAVFISVKVTTDQVEPVSEILKDYRSAAPAASAPEQRPAEAGSQPPIMAGAPAPHGPGGGAAATEPTAVPRPLPHWEPERPAAAAPALGEPQRGTATSPARRRDSGQLGRYLIYYTLALVAAFMIGAWLGMLS